MLALRALNSCNFGLVTNHYIGQGLLTKWPVMKLSFYDQRFLHASHILSFKLPDGFSLVSCSTSSVINNDHVHCPWQTVRDKCFIKCVPKPSSSLSGGESSCISRCVERYIEATGIISRAVITSLPR